MNNKYYIERANDFIDYYLEQWESEPNFKTFVDYQVVATNKSFVKENFESYKEAWASIGKDISKANYIYDEFFIQEQFESYPRTQEEVYVEIYAIVDSITEHPYNTNAMYEDEKPLIPQTGYINCSNCGKVFKSFEEYGKCNKCSLKAKKAQENKKLKSFTFNSFLYILIGFGILYFLFSLGYTTFLYVGGIGLFALLYFLDTKK